jgi:hypothetical protein
MSLLLALNCLYRERLVRQLSGVKRTPEVRIVEFDAEARKTVAQDVCEIYIAIIDVNAAKHSIRDQRLFLFFQTEHNVPIFDFVARLTDSFEFELASDLKRLNSASWHDGSPNVSVC